MSERNESYFATTIGLLGKTIPYLLVNAAVYAAFFMVGLIWFLVWLGLAMFFAERVPILSVVCYIIGIALGGFGWRLLKKYLLYLVKGGHIGVVTHKLMGRDLPSGMDQITYGKDLVQRLFKDVSMLFALDRLVDGTLRTISNSIIRIANMLPFLGELDQVVRTATEIFKRSLTYVDEAILSYSIAKEEENVWATARHAVILYAQNYKKILITAVKVWLASKVFFFLCLMFVGIPAAALMFNMESTVWQAFTLIIAFLAARLLELAIFEPFAMTYTLVTFHREIEGQVPDPTWDKRLSDASEQFRELTQKASSFVSGSGGPATQPAALAGPPPGAPPQGMTAGPPPGAPPQGMPVGPPPGAPPQGMPMGPPPGAPPQGMPAGPPPGAPPQGMPMGSPPGVPQQGHAPMPPQQVQPQAGGPTAVPAYGVSPDASSHSAGDAKGAGRQITGIPRPGGDS